MTVVDTSQDFGLIRVALPSLGRDFWTADLNGTEHDIVAFGDQHDEGPGGHRAGDIGVELLDLDLPSIDALLQGL